MIFRKIATHWSAVIHTGIYQGMPFIEARRTKLLNIVVLPGMLLAFCFGVLNLYQGRPSLSAVNFVHTLGYLLILYLNKEQRYLSARVIVMLFSLTLYGFSGFYFQNGAAFYLIPILVMAFLIYDNKWLLGCLSVLIIAVIALAYYAPVLWHQKQLVPSGRILANLLISLGIVVVALIYFKSVHVEYQQQTEAQRKTLDILNRDKVKLFSIIAHDIRSPLATLESLLGMFSNGQYEYKEMKDAAAELHLKVTQVGETLNNLLRWTASQMKGIHTEPVNVPLVQLIRGTLLTFEPNIRHKALQMEIKVCGNLQVYADSNQLVIILRNLISNAIKFSHREGLITIRAGWKNKQVHLSVADNGIGMTKERLETLFSFTGQPAYGTDGERGSGIGLMLCSEFAKQNDGEISVESMPGKGTTFRLLLPGRQEKSVEEEIPA
ncbi:sensor histidine kinase [Chitinophaga flava]|nr:HAMP domain-containing sensor histidine kinase [Chitinophaga flava]